MRWDEDVSAEGWAAEKVQCDLCTNTWVAVYPADLLKLQCPRCNNIAHFTILESGVEE